MRRVASLLAALALAGGLAACGGGGGSSTSAPAPAPAPTPSGGSSTAPAATRPDATPAKPSGSPAGHGSSESPQASAERRAAGRAAPFVQPNADNSIPTYGSESSATQRGEVEAALRSYLSGRAKGDWATACSQLAAAPRGQLETLARASKGKAGGCAHAYAVLSSRVPPAQRASPLTSGLAALRVKGDNAFALFYGPHRQQYIAPMVSEGGAWKINQIEPIPYPLGSQTSASP